MLMPKRVKYRRVHRGRMTGKATRGNTLAYGEFGLVATEPAWPNSPYVTVLPLMALPVRRPRWTLRYLTLLGRSITERLLLSSRDGGRG